MLQVCRAGNTLWVPAGGQVRNSQVETTQMLNLHAIVTLGTYGIQSYVLLHVQIDYIKTARALGYEIHYEVGYN